MSLYPRQKSIVHIYCYMYAKGLNSKLCSNICCHTAFWSTMYILLFVNVVICCKLPAQTGSLKQEYTVINEMIENLQNINVCRGLPQIGQKIN